jgi:hypothetical protein
VDESAGMCHWAHPAANMLSFCTRRIDQDFRSLSARLDEAVDSSASPARLRDEAVDHSDSRFDAFVALDLDGYSLEWFELHDGQRATAGWPEAFRTPAASPSPSL